MEDLSRKFRTAWCWGQVYMGWKSAQAQAQSIPDEKQLQDFWQERHEHFAFLIWNNITELQGWWVKVGQFLSTRQDLLPKQYIHHLVKLQDKMPHSTIDVVLKIIREELGNIDDYFKYVEEVPLASASIAQVHKAYLLDGTPVVIKVQHPNVEKLLSSDMRNLRQLSWAFEMLEKGFNFVPVLDEWQKAAAKELDFRQELNHQLKAYEAVQISKLPVIIPKCYPHLSSKRILVMDFVECFKLTDTDKLNELKINKTALIHTLWDFFAYQIHIDGFFNGDPHPGNVMVHIEGNDPTTAKLVILDWGLIKEYGPQQQIAFAKLVYSISTMDMMGLMGALEEMGFKFKENNFIDPEVYMSALRVAFRDSEGSQQNTDLLKSKVTKAVKASKNAGATKSIIMEKNPLMDWPKDIVFFLRVASLLHGMTQKLEVSIPFLQIMAKRAQACLMSRYKPPCNNVYTSINYYNSLVSTPRRKIKKVESRIHLLLQQLYEKNILLGCQVALIYKGNVIVNTHVGKMGPVDNRPVSPDSLFCGYCVTKGLLTTSLLQLIEKGLAALDDKVCHWWDGFIRKGKKEITLRHVLTHRMGFDRFFRSNLTISDLIDYEKMCKYCEDIQPVWAPGEKGHYAYLIYGWIVSELVRLISGYPIDQYIKNNFIYPLNLDQEIFFPIDETEFLKDASEGKQQSNNEASLKYDNSFNHNSKDEQSTPLTAAIDQHVSSLKTKNVMQSPQIGAGILNFADSARQSIKTWISYRAAKYKNFQNILSAQTISQESSLRNGNLVECNHRTSRNRCYNDKKNIKRSKSQGDLSKVSFCEKIPKSMCSNSIFHRCPTMPSISIRNAQLTDSEFLNQPQVLPASRLVTASSQNEFPLDENSIPFSASKKSNYETSETPSLKPTENSTSIPKNTIVSKSISEGSILVHDNNSEDEHFSLSERCKENSTDEFQLDKDNENFPQFFVPSMKTSDFIEDHTSAVQLMHHVKSDMKIQVPSSINSEIYEPKSAVSSINLTDNSYYISPSASNLSQNEHGSDFISSSNSASLPQTPLQKCSLDQQNTLSFPNHAHYITINTPLKWRLASSARKVTMPNVSNEEVINSIDSVTKYAENRTPSSKSERMSRKEYLKKVEAMSPVAVNDIENLKSSETAAQDNSAAEDSEFKNGKCKTTKTQNATSSKPISVKRAWNLKFFTKKKETEVSTFVEKNEEQEQNFVSPLNLLRTKPHVLDPLLYDGKHLVHRLIPSTNGRYTALGLAKFYSALSKGLILQKETLRQAMEVQTQDRSFESLILTGGGSRVWGLGYQLYNCKYAPNNDRFSEKPIFKPYSVGIGHGDFGGSVAMCFPDQELSIAILLNDVIKGPEASQALLNFTLPLFGLIPNWNQTIDLEHFL